MSSEWDMPQPAIRGRRPMPGPARSAHSREAAEMQRDGLLDPFAVVAIVARNALKIGIIAAVLTAIGVAALLIYPFPYKSTAIVLADPREQRVTLQEGVLSAIGADAAVLESMVQIVKSDGFLLKAMRELGIDGASDDLNQQARLKALAKFRKNLTVERKGATYLVEISYSATNPEEAARLANGIANAFAGSQNLSRSEATGNAAKSLAKRLVELRANLNTSEEAVAQFKSENGIVFVDQNNTLQMRQLTELSQQLALAKNATEEARARYDEVKNGGTLSVPAQQNGESGQLAYLRQQRTQLAQSLDQQQQIYGPRHPRIQQTQQMLRGVDGQIADEHRLLEQQLKATLDVAAAKQAELGKQISSLSSGVNISEAAQIKLDALEREAAANREIYQQFLARNKQTDELALLVEDNVRIVSHAVPPLRSKRPSLTLVAPAIAVLSLVVATIVAAGPQFGALVAPSPRQAAGRAPRARPAPRPAPTARPRPAYWDEPEPQPRRRIPPPDPVSLLDAWSVGEPAGAGANHNLAARRDRRGADRAAEGRAWYGRRRAG